MLYPSLLLYQTARWSYPWTPAPIVLQPLSGTSIPRNSSAIGIAPSGSPAVGISEVAGHLGRTRRWSACLAGSPGPR